ncbi:MAG: ABC transporter permease [Phycisphaerales bacterium]|nr:ABC transporter permease [Phycisphaerales bacterium]
MPSILAMIRKDVKLLLRDRASAFFAFVFPVLFAIFFGYVFSGGGGGGKALQIACVDEDQSEASQRFVQALKNNADLQVTDIASEEQATKAVLTRQQVAFVHILKGFGAAQDGFISTGKGGGITIGIDPSRQAETGWIQGLVQQAAYTQLFGSFSDPKVMRRQLESARASLNTSDINPAQKLIFSQLFSSVESLSGSVSALGTATDNAQGGSQQSSAGGFQPVQVTTQSVQAKRDLPSDPFAVSFPQGIIWGIMGCAMGFAASFAGERTSGTFLRLCAAPLTPRRILLAKGLASGLVMLVVSGVMLLMAVVVFKVQIPSYPIMAGCLLVVTLAFVGIMMFAASVGKSEAATNRAGWAIMMCLAMLGGAAVPLFVMPPLVRDLSVISPIRWAMLVLEGGVWRGWSFTDQSMLVPMAVLLGIAVVGASAGMALVQRQARA